MKKIIFVSLAAMLSASVVFTSCSKKTGANTEDARNNQELTNAAESDDENEYANYLKTANSALDTANDALEAYNNGDYSKALEAAGKATDLAKEYADSEDYKKAMDAYNSAKDLYNSEEYKDTLDNANKALNNLKELSDKYNF